MYLYIGFKVPQIATNRDHKASNGGTLGGAGEALVFEVRDSEGLGSLAALEIHHRYLPSWRIQGQARLEERPPSLALGRPSLSKRGQALLT